MSLKLISSQIFIILTVAALAILTAMSPTYAASQTPHPSTNSAAVKTTAQAPNLLVAQRNATGTIKQRTRRLKKKCNGQTTADCCKGLSYCTCLYMPGSSDDDHPTSCFKGTPPSRN